MNSKLLLIKREEQGVGVKRHWQRVQGKSWRQGQGWGEVLKHHGGRLCWGQGMARVGDGNVFTAKSRRRFLVRVEVNL